MSKPFLKWPGGKTRLIQEIKKVLPPAKRLFEPFVGGGSVFLGTQYEQYVLSDKNQDLVNLYNYVKNDGRATFIDECRDLFGGTSEAQYLKRREQYNKTRDQKERAILLLYLNKHGFNGLMRYNIAGEFNVPFGNTAPRFPQNEMLDFRTKAIGEAAFFQAEFDEIIAYAEEGDVCYLDPPYVPTSKTASFTSYGAGGFDMRDQERLVTCVLAAVERGASVVISNSDTPESRRLYAGANKLVGVKARGSISAKGSSRGCRQELFACYSRQREVLEMWAREDHQPSIFEIGKRDE